IPECTDKPGGWPASPAERDVAGRLSTAADIDIGETEPVRFPRRCDPKPPTTTSSRSLTAAVNTIRTGPVPSTLSSYGSYPIIEKCNVDCAPCAVNIN